jgi:DNA-binding NarL/FixJ family response regulator
VIRIVVIDDHPALRAGLRAVLDAEPGIVFVGESDGQEEGVWPVLRRARPDLVLLDYHLPHGDGLQLCYRIKHEIPAPRVGIFTAYASPTLALPATLARADALLAKDMRAQDLFDALRRIHGGERLVPPISRTVFEEAAARLDDESRALLGMLLDGATEADAATTLRLEPRDVRHAVQRILRALRLDVPAARTA